jgi:hypothetical protein
VPQKPIGAGKSINVTVAGVDGVPAGATAVALNVTAVGATGPTFLTVWPTGATRPTTSNLNPNNSGAVANFDVVAIGSGGQISVFNLAGSVNVVVDIAGYITP